MRSDESMKSGWLGFTNTGKDPDRVFDNPLTFKCQHHYRISPGFRGYTNVPTDYDPVGFWMFICSYCEKFHYHSPGMGHRVAQCEIDHKETEDGYFLVLDVPKIPASPTATILTTSSNFLSDFPAQKVVEEGGFHE